jgi:hypothetical protein
VDDGFVSLTIEDTKLVALMWPALGVPNLVGDKVVVSRSALAASWALSTIREAFFGFNDGPHLIDLGLSTVSGNHP